MAMDGLPTTIRLLDPPLHEFLPDLTELSVRVALAEPRGTRPTRTTCELLRAVHPLHEQNPMLGLRGVRLGLVVPGLFACRSGRSPRPPRQLIEAAATRRRRSWSRWSGPCMELDIIRDEPEGPGRGRRSRPGSSSRSRSAP